MENKRQGHVTLPFLKIDMQHWGPHVGPQTLALRLLHKHGWDSSSLGEVCSANPWRAERGVISYLDPEAIRPTLQEVFTLLYEAVISQTKLSSQSEITALGVVGH